MTAETQYNHSEFHFAHVVERVTGSQLWRTENWVGSFCAALVRPHHHRWCVQCLITFVPSDLSDTMNLIPSADLTFGLVFVWLNLCYNKLGHCHWELCHPHATFTCKRTRSEIFLFYLIHYLCKTTQVNGDAFSLNLHLFRFYFNRAYPYKLKIHPDHNKEIYWRPGNYSFVSSAEWRQRTSGSPAQLTGLTRF